MTKGDIMLTVIELQTNEGTTSAITNAYNDESLAYQKYYQILSYAAVSGLDIHSAVILNEYGGLIRSESFNNKESN